jgi:phytoene desaturase
VRAVVIGSGFGGLASAIRLAVKGYEVTILEKRDRPGGRASVFTQDGFTFDAGPTIITAPQLFDDLFTLAGRRIEDYVRLFPIDPFYRIGSTTARSSPTPATRAHARGGRGFSRTTSTAGNVSWRAAADLREGLRRARHVPFLTRIDGAPCRTSSGSNLAQRARPGAGTRTKLRQVFSFHPLLVGGGPQHAGDLCAHLPSWAHVGRALRPGRHGRGRGRAVRC